MDRYKYSTCWPSWLHLLSEGKGSGRSARKAPQHYQFTEDDMSPSNTVKEREGRKKNVKIDQGRTPISQEPYEATQMSPGPLMFR